MNCHNSAAVDSRLLRSTTVSGWATLQPGFYGGVVASMSIEERLDLLRGEMAVAGYDALVVPRSDEYLGEYLPAHNERLRWVSGFTGSAGLAVVYREGAAIFVDGRYTVQVRQQVPGASFEYRQLPDESPAATMVARLPAGARVAVDSRLHTLHWYRDTAATLAAAGIALESTPENLVDRCWRDRPDARVEPALLLGLEYTGEASIDKRRRIAADIVAAGADAALIFAPESVSWLLNVRGVDVPMLPVLQAAAVLAADGTLVLLVDPRRLPADFMAHVGPGVRVEPETAAAEVLAAYGGRRVLADPDSANAWTQLALEAGGCSLLAGADPVLAIKACKNAVELAGSRRAHIRDAVAVISFLAWLDAEVTAGRLHDEAALADELLSWRRRGEQFQGNSFATISAAGANAAMCHYNHQHARPAVLSNNSVYLVDSGGQYTDGTTDITRTVAIGDPGAEIRRLFTLVLKGHIALDQMRFPVGTSGHQLDAVARQFLWREGLDYDHGTGHGVGVFLGVHEGPQRISKAPGNVALCPGMIVSNEPGYYRDGAFGIRCENLVVVCACDEPGLERPMLEFEAISLVPFDRRLLDRNLLRPDELDWINRYHRRVAETVGPLLAPAAADWLVDATRPLAGAA